MIRPSIISGAPVACSINGKGTLPEDHPLSVGAGYAVAAVRELADDSDAVYYLYYKSEGKILKIGVPSPDIFESYARNDWADVVAIDGADLARYQDATLVKSVSNPAVYRIENGQARPFESENAFMRLGYDFQDIVDINDAHLSTYRRGQPVR